MSHNGQQSARRKTLRHWLRQAERDAGTREGLTTSEREEFKDVLSRMIVGWRAATRMSTELTLDALEQALWARKIQGNLIHHSDHGSQPLSIRYTERSAETGVTPLAGSVGDGYDNALAETINGIFKAEAIHRQRPWRSLDAVECAPIDWVDWFNNRRLLEPISCISPGRVRASIATIVETTGSTRSRNQRQINNPAASCAVFDPPANKSAPEVVWNLDSWECRDIVSGHSIDAA